jgi:hypothetical protein
VYLSDCRAYELVSPPYKEGGVVQADPGAISPNGEDLVLGIAGATSEAGNEPYDASRAGDIVAYRIARSGSGWQYQVLTPPASEYERSALLAISDDATFSKALWGAQAGTVAHKEDIYLQAEGGTLAPVGPGEVPSLQNVALPVEEELTLVGASSDLTRSLFTITNNPGSGGGHADLWPGDTTAEKARSLYEYSYDGVASTEPTLVGVRNQGALKGAPHLNEGAELVSRCGTELGSGAGGSAYNAVSQDGEVVFFTARSCGSAPAVDELYARVGGSRTVAISEPTREDCEACSTTTGLAPAVFVGASQSGEKVFFTTEQELLPGQQGVNLYLYDFGAPQASAADPNGRIALISAQSPDPEVQGVVRVSEDGTHVYFVAKAVLSGASSEGQTPEAGADNLYVYEPNPGHPGSSHVVFVAKLLTPGQEAEAAVEEERIEGEALARAIQFWERRCPPAFENLSCLGEVEETLAREKAALGYFDVVETLNEDRSVWRGEDRRPAQATPDGRFLVFESSSRLTADDTSRVPQIFEYDSEGGAARAGSLARVSIGQGGSYSSDGNVSSFREAPQIPRPSFAFSALPTAARFGLAVSDDGSRVLFASSARLTPLAVSGQASVFEYREGDVYLLSDGNDKSLTAGGVPTVQLYGSDQSGGDVFFTSADALVPQSGDTQQALYDAREEGGFPAPALAAGCMGELCRGAIAFASSLGAPESAVQHGGDNAIAGSPTKPRSSQRARARRLARALDGCARLSRRRRAACRRLAVRRYGPMVGSRAAGRSPRRSRLGGRARGK